MPQKEKNLSDVCATTQALTDGPILSLFRKRHAELWHATRILGGYEASRIVDKCAARLENLQGIDGRIWVMLNQIHSILSLDETDDLDKPFMGYFAAIDPNDPIVEEICELTDALWNAINRVVELRQTVGEGKLRAAA